nr:immunoglobulin heavy chain junction region [Macaca mulatta]
CARVQSNFDLW